MTRRPAVTLVELLVVVAIIGVLVGLLLPAVQQVRAAAARAACANHLKQLALAAHNHAAAVGHFPAGRGTPAPLAFSAHARLLPYLEQGGIDARLDYTQPPASYTAGPLSYDGSRNFPAASSDVRVFRCPADASGPKVPGSEYGATNYPANAGTGANAGTLASADGVFFTGSAVRIVDITDGTSQTALFGDRPLGDGPGGTDPRRGVIELPGNADPTPAACGGAAFNRDRGAKWVFGNYGNTLYNHADSPDPAAADCTNATQQKGRMAARSLHSGGVNLALADGGVRFVRSGIDAAAWRALGSRAGGEVGGAD